MKKSGSFTFILLVSTLFIAMLTPVLAYQDTDIFNQSRKEAVVAYTLARVKADGGFAETAGNASLITTYHGIKCLDILGVLAEFAKSTTVTWIDSFQNASSGAYRSSDDPFDLSIQATSYAISSLMLLGDSAEIETSVVDFINSLQNNDGGYGNKEGNSSTISATYLAIRALLDYNSTNDIGNATEWLQSRQNNFSSHVNYGAFITNLSLIQYSIVSSWEAVEGIYHVLQENINIDNTDALINWVNSCQNLEYNNLDKGSFRNSPSESASQMIYAAAAARIVKILNRQTDIDVSWLASWILTCQNTDGGFGATPEATESTLSSTYYAVLTLDALGHAYLLNEIVPWQTFPQISVVFIIFLIVLIVSICAIIIKKRYF
ncbi:MAG: hypothetical protein EAX96_19035 [Candidatus Lokiarchaeota archaeon]|nr:hypothetical protein [Candidatus Lokiarchaeota archaeon]